MAYGGAGGGDAEWEGIIAAKNELLTVKDDALAELQQDLARQKAMVARLFKVCSLQAKDTAQPTFSAAARQTECTRRSPSHQGLGNSPPTRAPTTHPSPVLGNSDFSIFTSNNCCASAKRGGGAGTRGASTMISLS